MEVTYVSNLLAGYAEVDFIPAPGQWLQGQQFSRQAKPARDPLMAEVPAFASGDGTVVMVAVEMCFIPTELVARAQSAFSERTELPTGGLLVHATHSHVVPYALPDRWEVDQAFLGTLCDAIVDEAERATERMRPVDAFSGSGQLENLGWNRGTTFSDGTS